MVRPACVDVKLKVADIAQPAGFHEGVVIKQQGASHAGERVERAVGDGGGRLPGGRGGQAVLVSVAWSMRTRLPDQQLSGGGRLEGAHQLLQQFGSVGLQEGQQVLQPHGDVGALVRTVEADEQARARGFSLHLHVAEGDAGQLTAHAGSGHDQGTGVGSVPEVAKDVREQGRIVEQSAVPSAKSTRTGVNPRWISESTSAGVPAIMG